MNKTVKPLKLLFPTFLKLLHFPQEKRKRILEERFKKDGYDFYKSVKKAVHDTALGLATFEECIDEFAKLTNEDEGKHNEYCYKVFYKWFLERPREFFPPPRKMFVSEHGLLKVKVEPELYVDLDGKKVALHMWNALDPDLEVSPAANMILLMRQNLFDQKIGDIRCGIFHGRTARVIWDEIISERALALLPRELRITESIWIKLNKEREEQSQSPKLPSTPKRLPPDSPKRPPL